MGDASRRTTADDASTGRILGYPSTGVAFDAAAILGVAGVLVAVHFLLPQRVVTNMASRHPRVLSPTLLTAAYVHLNDAHLFGNLADYLTGSVMAYVLCLQTGRRPWFHRTFAALVVALPVAVNLANYAAFVVVVGGTPPTSLGFSGATAGFAGFVFVAFCEFLAVRYDRATVSLASVVVLFGLFTELYYIYDGRVVPPLWAVLGVATTALGAWRAYGRERRLPRTHAALERTVGAAVPVVLVVAVLGYFVYR